MFPSISRQEKALLLFNIRKPLGKDRFRFRFRLTVQKPLLFHLGHSTGRIKRFGGDSFVNFAQSPHAIEPRPQSPARQHRRFRHSRPRCENHCFGPRSLSKSAGRYLHFASWRTIRRWEHLPANYGARIMRTGTMAKFSQIPHYHDSPIAGRME